MFSNGGTIILTNVTFFNNRVAGGEGGLGSAGSSANGTGLGGAVFAVNGSLTATFSTFSGNTAPQGGTGVYLLGDRTDSGVRSTGTVTGQLVNNILGQADNSVTDFVAGTTAGGGVASLASSSNNLVRNNGGLPAAAVVSSGDPLLSPLLPHGGPTGTLALQFGSPAIAAGVVVAGVPADQRGVTRATPPSLGADEPPNVPTIDTPVARSVNAATAALGGTVSYANAAAITRRGVVYARTAVNANPTLGGAGVVEVDDPTIGTGAFTVRTTGLTPETGYSFVAFATNSAGPRPWRWGPAAWPSTTPPPSIRRWPRTA